jgi:DnaJ-class molecular chaperone
MRDPYSVLGVAKSASAADIKAAYRRLAKKYHPDRNATDARAKERFAEVSGAYDILGDADKRRRFDRGEIDAEGKPRFAGSPFGSDFGGFRFRTGGAGAGTGGGPGPGGARGGWRTASSGNVDDILREFMSGMGGGMAGGTGERRGKSQAWSDATAPGKDLEVDVTLTIEDLAADEKVRVSLPNGRTVDMKIPHGVEDGQQVRLRGQGDASPTGSLAGDAIMTIRIAPHPRFRREGADLHLDLPITLYDAVLGAKV